MSFEQEIVTKLRTALVGKTVKEVGFMRKDDQVDMGWGYRPIVLTFEDGNYIFPMADDEGNEAGALATSVESCETVGVMR